MDGSDSDSQTSASDPSGWVDQHGDALFRYALLRVRSTELAEDLVQEALVAALAARHQFEGRSAERTWLVGILRNKIVDHVRRAAREQPADQDRATEASVADFFDRTGHWKSKPAQWPSDPGHVAEDQEFWRVFDECMGKLPGTLAHAFTLRELEELPTDRICKLLSVTPSNLWARLHRARMLLRRCLEFKWFAPEA